MTAEASTTPRRALPPVLVDPTPLLDALDDYADSLEQLARQYGDQNLYGQTCAQHAAGLREVLEEHQP